VSDNRVNVSITINGYERTYELWETSAPDGYDGFGTFTIIDDNGKDERGRPCRYVLIDKKHVDWQTGRYSSGLFRGTAGGGMSW
jgi:hypothetical protein